MESGVILSVRSCKTRRSFFFQAEDGIRDRNVTGVQTCALPIFEPKNIGWTFPAEVGLMGDAKGVLEQLIEASKPVVVGREARHRSRIEQLQQRKQRSEERRVGKEGRTRWGRGCGKEK